MDITGSFLHGNFPYHVAASLLRILLPSFPIIFVRRLGDLSRADLGNTRTVAVVIDEGLAQKAEAMRHQSPLTSELERHARPDDPDKIIHDVTKTETGVGCWLTWHNLADFISSYDVALKLL
jgi:hypothetical protein